MATTADSSKIVSYAVLDRSGPDLSKIVSYAVLDGSSLSFSLDATISNYTSIVVFNGDISLSLDKNIDPSISNATLETGNFRLDKTIDSYNLDGTYIYGPIDFVLDVTLAFTPYLRLIPSIDATASLDPFHDPIWVAVEFYLKDFDDNEVILRLSNRGVVHRTVDGVIYQYEPRLSEIPVELGSTLTVTSYGSPVRGSPNGGLIRFAVDESIWGWFTDYRWIGNAFIVYYGTSTDPVQAEVNVDLFQVAAGRIASLKHDTLEGTIQTSDESLLWDDPLISDFYDKTFPKAIRGKPRPYLWGYAFGLEPILIHEATQTYEVSHRTGGLDYINEVRVGGIPWRLNFDGPPAQGEWTPDLPAGTFALGSPPLGMDVRCDAKQGSFTVAGLIEALLELTVNIDIFELVDHDYMDRLNVAMPGQVSYATTTTPVNRLDAIDDVVTNSGCWWAVGQPINRAIAGVIDVPALLARYILDETNIDSIELNTIQPPAWRIRVGFQRNWSPQSSFATSVLQAEQKKWSESGQVNSPEYVNDDIKLIERRSVEVPLLTGTFVDQGNANAVQQRLVRAWGTTRWLFDVKAFIDVNLIRLYDTIAVDYMTVTGNFIVTSAIRAIGRGPATLQLWGSIGPFAVQPPDVVVPEGEIEVGTWMRLTGSGTFTIGVDTPVNVTRIQVRGVGAGGGGAGAVQSGGFFYAGGGGGSGGYFEDTIITTADSEFDWVAGAGGDGMSYGVFGTAGDGGDTTFGSFTGFGGSGGVVSAISQDGGAGGGASGAAVVISGAAGGAGYSTTDPPGECCDVFTANGASSAFGGGKHASTTTETFQGAPGSGGGGHVGINSAASTAGEDGMVIVTWFTG